MRSFLGAADPPGAAAFAYGILCYALFLAVFLLRMLLPIPRGSGSGASGAVREPSVGTGGPSQAEAS